MTDSEYVQMPGKMLENLSLLHTPDIGECPSCEHSVRQHNTFRNTVVVK